ncbi:MAG: ABC transporter ATP-binding protein [Anaerolineae bacterium]
MHTYYGQTHVLRGVTMEVPAGSIVALMGRNGMGKSTTVHSVIGFTPHRRGQIMFNGTDISGLRPNRRAQLGLGLVPQGRRIFPSLSVRENLTLAARRGSDGRRWRAEEIYAFFPILKERATVPGTALSGGEQQMLAVARALMSGPQLILMVEPSEGLAPLLVDELRRILLDLKAAGLSILLVEQNLAFALSAADHVYVLNRGEIVYEAPPDELERNEDVKTRHLGVST